MSTKNTGYETFNISKRIRIEAWSYETRYSWGHKAELYLDNRLVQDAKITYYNRTWERFCYESILYHIVSKAGALTKAQEKYCNTWIKKYQEKPDPMFKTIANIARIGQVLTGGSQKETNDWKARMIKAGLSSQGLIVPEDWDRLTENEKEVRLNKVIAELEK